MSNTAIKSATVGIGGGYTIECAIVNRCEGDVPRFTVRDEAGALVGGDKLFKAVSAANLLDHALGVNYGVAMTLISHVENMAMQS